MSKQIPIKKLNIILILTDNNFAMFWNKNKKDRFDEIPETPIQLEVDQEFPKIPEIEELEPIVIPVPDDMFKEAVDSAPIIKPLEVVEKPVDLEKNEKIKSLERTVSTLKEENQNLKSQSNSYKDKTEKVQIALNNLKEENLKLKQDLSNLKNNENILLSSDLDKAKLISEKYNELAKTHEELKAKIRHDIRKIRLRETELSNRIELIRQDRDTLISAKDQKILKLKKQIEELEFQKQRVDEKVITLAKESKENAQKAERVIKALRLSTSLLESDEK